MMPIEQKIHHYGRPVGQTLVGKAFCRKLVPAHEECRQESFSEFLCSTKTWNGVSTK